MITFTFVKYLKYILFSRHKRGHGIHSPFVFEFVSRVLGNKTCPEVVKRINEMRRNLIYDNRVINVTDLGSGSGKMKQGLRKVSEIAGTSAIPEKYGKLLYYMSEEFGNPGVIELGTSLGISTMYLAAPLQGATVYSIEGCPETASVAEANFRKAGFDNIKLLTGTFDEMIPAAIANLNVNPGLVFIDGDHRKEPLLRYFNALADISDDKSVIVIDDIYHSEEMAEAWILIRNHYRVTVSIDIFRMGIVFFRKGMNKAGYVIRY